MEYKTGPGFFTRKTPTEGEAEVIFTLYGNLDLGHDIGHPGMFDYTTDGPATVKFLNQHNMDSVLSILGKILALRDLPKWQLPQELKAKYPEATGAGWAKLKYLLDDPTSAGAYARAAVGLAEFSYGYDTLQFDYSNVMGPAGETVKARNLRKVKLYEVSQCIIGMNPATGVISTKAAGRPVMSADELYREALILEFQLKDDMERDRNGGMTDAELRRGFDRLESELAALR